MTTKAGQWLTAPTITVMLPDDPTAPGKGTWARLAEPLGWADLDGQETWLPAGFTWNGASIPRPFWACIGHPLRARYLRASAVHDAGCQWRTESSGVVHRRFYGGLVADGVPRWVAAVFYAAVRVGGPQW